MAGFFIFSIACLCLAGAFLLAVLAYIAIKDMKQDEEKNPTVTLYDGIYEEEVFKLDSIQTICVQDGLPNDEHKIAVHLKNRDCYLGTSVKFE
jgi:hypothetical protein